MKNSKGIMEEKAVKVSFIIPTLNVEGYLPRCLESIKKQSALNVETEIIVVDNGSSDNTVSIAERYGCVVHELPKATISAVRNHGASKARGLLLAFIDSDCILSTHWLKNALKHFEDPNVAAAGAPTVIPDIAPWVERYWFLQTKGNDKVKKVTWLPSANMVVRKSVFEEIGGFNEDLITCEDSDIGYRLSKKYTVISDPSIKSIHLREPKTLLQFFKKEKWRGRGNLQGIFLHGIVWDELPSLLLPIYYLMALLFFPASVAWSLLGNKVWPVALSGILILGPVSMLALRMAMRNRSFKAFAPLWVLYLVYALARAVAIVPKKSNG